ncbi:MAG: phosphate acyltransferase PlsX [Alphaproteobacteria bacterium]
MSERVVIALDAMGGDRAPDMVVAGAALARERMPHVQFLMCGDEDSLRPLLAKQPALAAVTTIRHTKELIGSNDKPSTAIKSGRNSSMRLAIDAVFEGEASCVVSAGNTGALMAIAKYVLKTLPGIDRPAIATFFPTLRGECCMLDLGANVQCDANNLVQFAVMGEVFARTVLGFEQPTIGLLNIGVEDLKGNEEVREAAAILRDSDLPIAFKGFVEGDDIGAGTVDVVVTDGFTGNVALKTAEGTINFYTKMLKQAFASSWVSRLGYLLSRGAINNLRNKMDPRRYNGAMLLGLNGIVVKSHGGTDAVGFANAIGVAADMVVHGFQDKIRDDFERLKGMDEPDRSAAVV